MNVPNTASGSPGTELIHYKRKRCKNCDKKFPLTKPNREFCSVLCKNEYYRHGSAFGPLKVKLEKLVRKLVSEESKRGWSTQLATLKAAGFVMRDELPEDSSSEVARLVHAVERLTNIVKSVHSRVRVLEVAVTAPLTRQVSDDQLFVRRKP